jgi:two-component system phosphate regulon sensor histidine kinase PhoR
MEDRSVPHLVEKVDVRPVAEDALRMFDAKIKQMNLRLALEVDDGRHVVMGDAFKLEQVFVNLIDNALKYTERGTISVSLRGDGKRVTVEVADTGVGIAPEHLPRIFERFYVVDKSRSKKVGGTGLGLAIVKHIVLMHNGEVNVESAPGRGTKFTVTFPACSS